MHRLFLFVFMGLFISSALAQTSGQRFGTRTAKFHFFAGTPVENIEANNNQSSLVFDAANGKMEAATLIKGFHFERALMEEHFNENYMESSQFPKASFTGVFDPKAVNIEKDGVYAVKAKGKLTFHGVSKVVEVPGTITVVKGKITVKAVFEVRPEDFNIKIPGPVRDKIAKTVKIDIEAPVNRM